MAKKATDKPLVGKKSEKGKKKITNAKKDKHPKETKVKQPFSEVLPGLAKKLLLPISFLMFILCIILGVIIFKYAYNPRVADGIYVADVLIPDYSRDDLIDYLEKQWPQPEMNNTITIYYEQWEHIVTFEDLEVAIDYSMLANQIEVIGNHGWVGKRFIERLRVKRNGEFLSLPITFSAASVNTLLRTAYEAIHVKSTSSILRINDHQVSLQSGADGINVVLSSLSQRIISQINQLSSAEILIPIDVVRPPKLNPNEIVTAINQKANISYIVNDSGEKVVADKTIGRTIDMDVLINEILLLENRTDRRAFTRILPVVFTDPELTKTSVVPISEDTIGINDSTTPSGPTNSNTIAYFETYFGTSTKDDISRANNISLASKAIDGTIILPHELFSFNSITGPRSIMSGYQSAPVYQNGSVEMGIGGGVCQVSSTLFNASLLAGLTATERHEHMFPVSYVALGRDAAVSYGYQDLCILNPYDKPVLIQASVEDTKISVQIMMETTTPLTGKKIYTRVFSQKPVSSIENKKHPELSDNIALLAAETSGAYVETWIQEYAGENLLNEDIFFQSKYQPYPKEL